MENDYILQIATKWHTLCHLVSSPLKEGSGWPSVKASALHVDTAVVPGPAKGKMQKETLYHLVSCGGTKWLDGHKVVQLFHLVS